VKNYLAEFVGTAVLVLLGNGVVAGVLLVRSKAHNAGWLTIATGWGFAVAIAVYIVGATSGGHINPAVTLSLAAIGTFPWKDVPGYIVAQMLGAMLGAALVWITYFKHWAVTDDPEAKQACFCTAPAIRRSWANAATEFVGTFMLLFGILGIAANANAISHAGENIHLGDLFSTGLGPLLVGFLVLVIGTSLGGPTGYAINPARDLGPRIMHALLPIPGKGGSGWSYAVIPVLAPIAGGVCGALVWDALNFAA
jgi:glycerol uptake facilitator protein